MFLKRTVLLLLTFVSIVLFLNIPVYHEWFNKRIALRENIYDEVGMDLEQRKVYRWGDAYVISEAIKNTIERKNMAAPFVVIPTAGYMKRLYPGLLFPEPLTFYYFTGIKAVFPTSPAVSKANCKVIIVDNKLNVQEIKAPVASAEILNTYK